MWNECIVEGYIAAGPGNKGVWQYKKDTLFRLAVMREPFRPAKPNTSGVDEPDFITVRLPAEKFAGLPFTLSSSRRIRVKGYLQSREYQETLATFLNRANGMTNMLSITEEASRLVTHSRVTTELVAETIIQEPEDEGDAHQLRTLKSATQPRSAASASPNGAKPNGRRSRRPEGGNGNGNGNKPQATAASSPSKPAPAQASAPLSAPAAEAPAPVAVAAQAGE